MGPRHRVLYDHRCLSLLRPQYSQFIQPEITFVELLGTGPGAEVLYSGVPRRSQMGLLTLRLPHHSFTAKLPALSHPTLALLIRRHIHLPVAMYVSDRNGEYFATRPETDAERILYNYVSRLSRQDAEPAISNFYRLMFSGNTYPDQAAQSALTEIVSRPEDDQHLLYVINRCLYTIGNRWRLDPSRHSALRTLILQLDEIPQHRPLDPTTRQWLTTLQSYVTTDSLYCPLRRQLYLLTDSEHQDGTLADHFKDYFFIQETSTMTRDIPAQYRVQVRQQQRQQGQQLNQQLLSFWQDYSQTRPAHNPTRIPDPQLHTFIQAVHPNRLDSYQGQAQRLSRQLNQAHTMKDFRTQLHDYLIAPLVQADPKFAHSRVSRIIRTILDEIGADDARYNATLEVRACVQLLKQLVCNTLDNPKSSQFKHFIDKVGHQLASIVLLKIVLFRRTVQPWFEDRFGILFHTWERARTDSIGWVVQAFEYMNVALALNLNRVCYV